MGFGVLRIYPEHTKNKLFFEYLPYPLPQALLLGNKKEEERKTSPTRQGSTPNPIPGKAQLKIYFLWTPSCCTHYDDDEDGDYDDDNGHGGDDNDGGDDYSDHDDNIYKLSTSMHFKMMNNIMLTCLPTMTI